MDLALRYLEEEAAGGGEAAIPLSLSLIAAAAFLIPLLARRIRLPAVVLEIAFGLLVGPAVLNIVELDSLLEFLAEFGLFLVMFLAGFEIDFNRLTQGPRRVVEALVIVGAIFVAGWFGVALLDPADTSQHVFLTLLLAAAALGLVVPTLRGSNATGTRLGQISLLMAGLAEVISLVGVVIFLVVRDGWSVQVLNIPLLFLLIGAFLIIVKRLAWWFPERFERLFSDHDPEELGIRASLALLFVFAGIAAALEIEAILGAFLAGLLFAFVFRNRGGLEQKLSGFAYGFFIPIFFIVVGIDFPLDELSDTSVIGEAVALIAVAIAIKMIPTLLLVFRGFSIREALASGVLMAAQLSVIIALAEIGVEEGLMTPGQEAGAILLVAVTALATPTLFRWLVPPPPGVEPPPRPVLDEAFLH